ncbi:MAG: hypothetical protein LIO77_02510, partial [Rikenellaceae bacterium]|nr:hypothetical protein [Rikenellaceae bacterium]
MKRFLTLTFIIHLVCSCGEEDIIYTGTYFSTGFVSEYFLPEMLYFQPYTDHIIRVEVHGRAYGSGQPQSEQYKELARKWGDISYNQYLSPGINGALAVEPEGMRVVCDADLPGYPVGTPLDDMILMYGWTYKEYIDSRYTHYTAELEND